MGFNSAFKRLILRIRYTNLGTGLIPYTPVKLLVLIEWNLYNV